MSIEIKITCDECGRIIQLDDVVYCFECVEKIKTTDNKFISHIQAHLKAEDKVICKICGKSVEEIIKMGEQLRP